MPMRGMKSLLAAVVAVGCFSAAANANLLVNYDASFEDTILGAAPDYGFSARWEPVWAAPGWNVTNDTTFNMTNGSQVVYISPIGENTAGYLVSKPSASLSVLPNTTYKFEVDVVSRKDQTTVYGGTWATTTDYILLMGTDTTSYWDNIVLQNNTHTWALGETSYHAEYTFTTAGPGMPNGRGVFEIVLGNQSGSGGVWPQIAYDNVSLTVVPEPGVMGLLGLGTLALGRRRKA